MPTNDEIIEKTWGGAEAKYTRRETLRILMEQARADTIRQILAELDWVTIIKDAEFKTGAYDERTEAKAYQELRDRIEYLKKQHEVPR